MTHNPWHELLELTAAAVLTIGGAVALFLAWRRRGVEPGTPVPVDRVTGHASPGISAWPAFLAALSLGAGAIHLAAAPSHLEELGLAGLGFVGAGVFQLAWPVALRLRPSRGVVLVGIVANLAVLGAWAVSRTAGLPFGPSAGIPEAVGTADAAASIFEVALVALLLVRLVAPGGAAGAALRRVTSPALIAVVPAVGIVFLTSTLAVSAALAGHAHGPGESHGAGHGHADGPAAHDDVHTEDSEHAAGTDPDHHAPSADGVDEAAHDSDTGDHDAVAPSLEPRAELAPTGSPDARPSTPRPSPTPRSASPEPEPTDEGHSHGEGEDEPHAHP